MTLIGVAAVSQAFDLNFDGVQTGATPGGASPWASLSVTDGGLNTVNFVLTHSASSTSGQFLTSLWLNMNPYPGSPAIVESSPKITGAAFANKSITNAGITFDAEVSFATSNSGGGVNRLKPGESVAWQITGAGLTAAAFATTSGNSNVIAMIHVQGIGPNNNDSGKIIATVPEPTSMSALAAASCAMLARRRRKSK